MGYLVGFVIWGIAVGWFSYSVGYNYGSADAFIKARIQIYGS